MPVYALVNAGSIITAEIRLDVRGDIMLAKLARNLQIQPRKLRGVAKLRDVPLRRVAERDRGEIRGDVALRVRRAVNIFKIEKPAGVNTSRPILTDDCPVAPWSAVVWLGGFEP